MGNTGPTGPQGPQGETGLSGGNNPASLIVVDDEVQAEAEDQSVSFIVKDPDGIDLSHWSNSLYLKWQEQWWEFIGGSSWSTMFESTTDANDLIDGTEDSFYRDCFYCDWVD